MVLKKGAGGKRAYSQNGREKVKTRPEEGGEGSKGGAGRAGVKGGEGLKGGDGLKGRKVRAGRAGSKGGAGVKGGEGLKGRKGREGLKGVVGVEGGECVEGGAGVGVEGGAGGLGQVSGRRRRLDPLSVGYFRRVGERLTEEFTDQEEQELFVENVLTEVKDRAALVSADATGSVTLQKLLPLARPGQVGAVLAELGGESGSEFMAVACDRCGGHVVESALRQAARWTGEEDSGTLEDQVLTLCRAVRENVLNFITDPHGSHVVRTLAHVLAGCTAPERPDTRPAVKPRPPEPELKDFEAPPSFWWEFKHLSESLMENVNVCVTDATAGAVLQVLLSVCHRKRPILGRKLNRGIMGYLTSLGSAPGVSPLLVFLKDRSCSRLIQTLFLSSRKALLRETYRDHLRDQLMPLALHPFANYPVQSLVAASVHYKMFLKVFDELAPGFEAILAAGHMGVMVQLVESCVHREERQADMLTRLLEAFHCSEPASRHVTCLPLFLSLLTHEVYYGTETAEGDPAPQRPLAVCFHGSRLVQALARFRDRSVLMSSLHGLSPAELLELGTDVAGSHALQALITLSSDKGRGKVLRRLEGLYTRLACSRYGSRLLEAVWNSAPISQRQSIAEQLVPGEAQLRSDRFARHVWARFGLSHFQTRRGAWLELQTGQSKKRKMLSDVLE